LFKGVRRERISVPPDKNYLLRAAIAKERSWIGDINQHAAKKIQSSSFQLEIPDLLSLRSKRRKRSVIAASLKMPASPGLSRADKMQEFGAVSQKMSAVLLSAVLREIVHE
jgi:hypothetical protein